MVWYFTVKDNNVIDFREFSGYSSVDFPFDFVSSALKPISVYVRFILVFVLSHTVWFKEHF